MAATMLAQFARQTTRVAIFAVRKQTQLASSVRQFSFSASNFANRLYTEKHEWIQLADQSKVGTVGISAHAQESLGDIVYVQLPEVGSDVEKDGEAGCVESVKAVSDIYSPVAGKIVGVNEELSETPELINKSPLDKGWIFKVEVSDVSELEDLMDEAAYKEFIAQE